MKECMWAKYYENNKNNEEIISRMVGKGHFHKQNHTKTNVLS